MPKLCASHECFCQCCWPCGRPLSTHASLRDSQKLICKSESVCYGVTPPFSWVLVCTRFCLCPHIVAASLVLWKFCNPVLLIFNIWFPGDSKSLCYNSRLRNVLWDLEPLKQCRNVFDIIVLQFVDHLPNGSMVGLMTNSTKRTFAICHASQDWWFQCCCPHNKPLLTHASTGDPQTFTGSSESVSCWGGSLLFFLGSGAHKGLFLPS